MKRTTEKTSAIAIAGLVLVGSMLAATAFAAPYQGKKGKKTETKKSAAGKVDKVALAAGKKIYDANGCANCHKIAGAGGASGPELTHVAKNPKHTLQWLETSIVNPKADSPQSFMPVYKDKIKGKDLKNTVAYLSSLK